MLQDRPLSNIARNLRASDHPSGSSRVVIDFDEGPPEKPLHLAIGMFDGVHLGHQAVIEAAVGTARWRGGVSGVLTFWPHPSKLFRPEEATPQIMRPEDKFILFEALGVEWIFQQTFNSDFASVTADAFLPRLKKSLPSLQAIYVGENFRFGKSRLGTVDDLVQIGRSLGISVFSAHRVKWDGEPVSSTRIRKLLAEGPIESVNALLGYDYFIRGPKTAGRELGRTLGFPTLNVPWAPEIAPAHGVYAARVSGGAMRRVPAVMNYGLRPTVGESTTAPVAEAHLLQWQPDYDQTKTLSFELCRFIRPEKKFESLDALKVQIEKDRDAAKQYFDQSL